MTQPSHLPSQLVSTGLDASPSGDSDDSFPTVRPTDSLSYSVRRHCSLRMVSQLDCKETESAGKQGSRLFGHDETSYIGRSPAPPEGSHRHMIHGWSTRVTKARMPRWVHHAPIPRYAVR